MLEWRRSGWFNTQNRYALFREIVVYKRRRIHWFIDFNFRLSDSQWMTLDTHVICTYSYLNLVLSWTIIIYFYWRWIFYFIAIVSNWCRISNFSYYLLNSVMPFLASTKIPFVFNCSKIGIVLSVSGTFICRNNSINFLHCLHISIIIMFLLNKSLLLCI